MNLIRKIKPTIRKSQAFESWFFVIAAVLAAAIIFLVLNKAWGSIKPEVQTGIESSLAGKNYSNANVSLILDQTTGATRLFDKLIPFLIIGLFAFVLIMAGTIMRHPIMIIVGIVVLAVVIILAVIYSNLYNEISSSAEFSDTSNNLPIQSKFLEYLPIIVFLIGIGIAIAIAYSRSSGGTSL